jgi:putative ABC transport system permease protein
MTQYSRSLLEALESILSNKLRSGLTMLGIVIGVAAVISMLAIGTGAEDSITSQIEGIGANVLFVNSGGEAAIPEPLTLKDAEAISDPSRAPSVLAVAPTLQGNVTLTVPGESTNTSIVAVTPEYFIAQSVVVEEGTQITSSHEEGQEAVVILGTDVAEELFGFTTGLLDETVRIDGQPFKVIGILEEQGGTGFGSSDNQILVPLSTAQSRLLSRPTVGQVDLIYVQAVDSESTESATDEVSQILRAQHISTLGVDDFEILSTQAVLETASAITDTFTLVLGGIAGISLLVGGIGIMNIMMVSVIERTREIGLRKAMGAQKKDILSQFLIESLVLSILGGLIGILLGWGIANLIGGFSFGPGGEIDPSVSLNSVLLATLFSASVGVFFGIYPANRAANLEPVDALRSE